MGDGTNPAEQQSAAITSQQDADQQQAFNAEQGTLNQYEGPLTSSPIYQSLLTTGTSATKSAYDGARSAQKQAAGAAGFGYGDPVAEGADAGEQQQEAAAMAAVPDQAKQQAAGLQLQAAGLTGNEEGTMSPDSANSTTNSAYAAQQQANNNLWSSIAQAGMGMIDPVHL